MPTPLPRPGPSDLQDGPGTELDLLWDQMADVVEATETVANAAIPNADPLKVVGGQAVGIGLGSSPLVNTASAWAGSGVTVKNTIATKTTIADAAVRSYGTLWQASFDLYQDTSLSHIAFDEELTVSAGNTRNFGGSSAQILKNLYSKVEGSGSVYRWKNIVNTIEYRAGQARYLAAQENYVNNYSTVAETLGCNAMYCRVQNLGGGLIPTAWAQELSISNALGSITQANVLACHLINAAGQTITSVYGVNIGGPGDTWSNAGTITNCYALYIGSSTAIGTNKWSIYNDSPAPNYLKGAVGIGVSAPSAPLHVQAAGTQQRLAYSDSVYVDTAVDASGNLKFSGPLGWRPTQSLVPTNNGDLTVEATSNTSLTFRFKGTDGVVRSAALTLS